MRVRHFKGETVAGVMAEVRATLGPDAVILQTRQPRGGPVEIQAAIEAPRRPSAAAKGEAIVIEADLERQLREDLLGVIRTETLRERTKNRPAPAGTSHAESEFEFSPLTAEVREDGWVRTGTMGIVTRRIKAPGAIGTAGRKPAPAAAQPAPKTRSAAKQAETHIAQDPLAAALAFHGLPHLLREDLVRTARAMDTDDLIGALALALDARFALDPIAALPSRPIMLVGPPGAGKTVTAAKLAARAVLLGRGVDIISTDTLRAGAREQMQSFTSILKEELICINRPEDLEEHLKRRAGQTKPRPCFIDTPGTNPFSKTEIGDLRKFVKALDVEPVLVIAAGGDAAELADVAHVFATLGTSRMITTRIDTVRRIGGVLGAADSAKLNLAQFSMTPYIARGLSTLNPMSLARLLIDERAEDCTLPLTPTKTREAK